MRGSGEHSSGIGGDSVVAVGVATRGLGGTLSR
jgi:hypothetical protein